MLLDELVAHGVISSSTVTTAKKYIKMNSDWFEYSNMPIRDFLNDYYGIGNGVSNSKSYVSILVILVAVLGAHSIL